MARAPASIRYKNPGAQYPGSISRKYGSRSHEIIGGGHKIAVFPTMVDGAAALFGLMWKGYRGRSVKAAIEKWSGGNHVNSYLRVIEKHTDNDRYDQIDNDLLTDPEQAIPFAQAMARHETGQAYPMSRDQWEKAHELFLEVEFGGVRVPASGRGDAPELAPVEYAMTQLGTTEIRGPEDNPEIVQYFIDAGREDIMDDETPWCAAFVGAVLNRTGYAYLDDNLLARGYLNYGVEIDEPEVGALIIMKRGSSSWQGHVAFVSDVSSNTIKYVGGNQRNSVTVETIGRDSDRILGYRRPIPLHRPAREIVKTPSVRYKTVGLLGVLSTMVYEFWGGLVNGLADFVDFAGSSVGLLPEFANEAKTAADAGAKIAQTAGLPWPVTAAIAIVGASIAFNLYSTWKRKRDRKDDD